MWDAGSNPERTKLMPHAWAIQAVAFSRDSGTLACADYGTIKLLDAATGQERLVITTRHWLFGMALAPDGRALASGGNRGRDGQEPGVVKLWDAATGDERAALDPHMKSVQGVAFSPDGSLLAAWSWTPREGDPVGAVALWDAGGKGRAAWQGYGAVAFDPGGQTVALAGQQGVLLWDAGMGRPRATPRGHTGRVASVCFAPDGRVLATGGTDGTARLWDADTGQERAAVAGHPGGDLQVEFSPDGKTLAVLCLDRGTAALARGGHTPPAAPGSGGAAPGGTVTLWDAGTAARRAVLRGVRGPMAFTPDGLALATAGGGAVVLWRVATGQELLTLPAQPYPITCLAFAPNGRLLAAGAGWRDEADGVYLWRAGP